MDPTALQLVWFLLIALMFTVYFVVDGMDFGTVIAMPFLDRGDERRRRQILNTIYPIWDGNQVWLIVAGASLFAAFPEWYASLFSGFYLAMLLILVTMIVRIVSFKYRNQVDTDRWRKLWDVLLMIGSWAPAFLWGVVMANIVRGVAMTADHAVTTSLLGLLNPYALLGGLTFVAAFALHGCAWLTMRTAGEVRARARVLGLRIAPVVVLVAAAFLLWTQLSRGAAWTWAPLGVAALALVAGIVLLRAGRDGLSFAATSLAIVGTAVTMFGSLFPDVLPATNDAAHSLTIANASSSPATLTVMLVAVAIILPLTIAYQSWGYWVTRHRTTEEDQPTSSGLLLNTVRESMAKNFG